MRILFFLLIGFLSSNLYSQQTVVDYYKLLPDSLVFGYELSYENGKWISQSYVDYEIYPEVDIRNGYICITDEGTGAGIEKLTVVLYRKSDGSALIAVSHSVFDITADCSVKFLEYKNDNWEVVNDNILPPISYNMFMNDNYLIPDTLEGYSVYFDLPQHGTTINLILEYDLLRMFCGGAFSNVRGQKQKTACDFTENVRTDTVQLFWRKSQTEFKLK